MSTLETWKTWIDECRKQEFPVVVTGSEPWFAIGYLCANFLMIEKTSDFVKKCKAAKIPMIRVNQKPLIKFSDIEKVCIEQPAEDEDGIPVAVPVEPQSPDVKPRKNPKARG
jgi:hypothetical protein